VGPVVVNSIEPVAPGEPDVEYSPEPQAPRSRKLGPAAPQREAAWTPRNHRDADAARAAATSGAFPWAQSDLPETADQTADASAETMADERADEPVPSDAGVHPVNFEQPAARPRGPRPFPAAASH
jgi:hypothetical protein